ncbi:MAG: hypothetical protein QOF11_635 [Chloroflexota bacterium]|jgi:hypothetical protein|nr:hypothetical protein [Chloroflexota bacterium]
MIRARLGLISLAGPILLLIAGPTLAASTPAAVWHMDERSGSTMGDGSGHANNGALKNVKLGLPGLNGSSAFGFDGKSSVITVPDSASLSAGSADLVVTVHVAFNEVPEEDYDLIRKGLSSTPGGDWKIEIVNVGGKGIARCYLKGSGGSWQKTTGPDLADGRWHTITCEKHATTVVLSVDGKIWKKTKSLGTLANKAPLSIGAKAEGGDWYAGAMDEVSIVTGS